MEFKDKIVLVTGASGALGSIIVETFLQHGATVVAAARHADKIKVSHQPASAVFKMSADVTDESDVVSLFSSLENRFGGVDILVHTVGGFVGGKTVQHTSAAEWDSMMSLNLRSAFLCSKSALPHMENRGGGKIVTISAMAALEPKAKRAAYLTSKAGLIALTQAIAEEGKAINVQANAIAPAIILTAANRRDMPDMDHSLWIKPEDIAATVLFLCSAASRSLTGNVIKML